ncbi:hypothetical protein P3T76_015701 [Phytophthora citrophthora]|uniref:Uncharacterized protein n=1 Tax=Phytophthora citrophthora TaxID=4793 RepID=A0AAD9LA11_9STRA|nr:hypothetical protein P3T76_015701 [Phytophthora citrophthora]
MEEEVAGDPSRQLFNVVYDPSFDRFFLEDESVYRGRNRSLDRKAVSIPWQKWILPPKSSSKHGDSKPVPPVTVENGDNQLTIPTLDLSSLQEETNDTSKKARVQNYATHFKRSNQEVAQLVAASVDSADTTDDHEVKWNGEILHVQIPGLEGDIPTATESGEPNSLAQELVRAGEQWPGSTFDLKTLSRIRAHADGLRLVNSANRFLAVSSSDSSESEEEVITPPKEESEEERELMPVFFRDDRVLFHARRRWFKGIVRRRIPKSDFYTIRADNGSLFDAILASKMELIDEPEEIPYFHYRKGDKVLWIPGSTNAPTTNLSRSSRRKKQYSNNSEDEELTYKAKIVQVRSLNRFDVLLRTGRVVKKVLYEQLRPRDASEFVSTMTPRRR